MGARPLPSCALTEHADQPRHHLIDKLHARRVHHRRRPKPVRVLYAVAGATLVLAGTAMLVLPGPAFVVLPLGLFLLALEFAWAEAALVASLRQAERAREKAARASTAQRVASAAAVLALAAAAAAWAVLGDVPVVPV